MSTESSQPDFDCFHRDELPVRLAAGNGALAHDLAQRLGSLAIQVPDGRSYTYAAIEGKVLVLPGSQDARTVIEMDLQSWANLVKDLETGPGLLYSQRGKVLRGDGMAFIAWESAWRAMYHGRPIFEPADQASSELRDRAGKPLNVQQVFTPDSDLADVSHFMDQAGFVLVRGVFSPEEVEVFWGASDWLKAQAREGDQQSWWGKSSSGEAVLTRVLEGSIHAAFRGLESEERLTRLLEAIAPDLVPNLDAGDFASVLYKNPDMVEGLSDLPWHRDCGMGGHAAMCPTINLSIFLSEASPATGPLKVLPGSHRGSVPALDSTSEKAPTGIFVAGKPGDVSLHYGDLMHAAPPPEGQGPFRRSAVLTWRPAGARPHTGERHYNDVLLEGSEDGQVAHLQQVLDDA